MSIKLVLVLVGIASAVGAAGWWALMEPDGDSHVNKSVEAVSSPTELAETGNKPDVPTGSAIQGIGFVEPTTEVRRLAFRTGGVISVCQAEIGKEFKQGDILAELANGEEQAAVQVTESQLTVARAEQAKILRGIHEDEIRAAEFRLQATKERLAFYTNDYERRHQLWKQKATSESDYRQALMELDAGKANVLEAEAQLAHLRTHVRAEDKELAAAKVTLAVEQVKLAKERLAKTQLLAPFAGEVLEVLKREGESVNVDTLEPVILFADLTNLRIRVEVDERHAQRLAEGQAVRVFGRNLQGKSYDGHVVLLKSMMGSRSVFARLSTERKDLEVVQFFVEMGPDFRAPVGLRVDVAVSLH